MKGLDEMLTNDIEMGWIPARDVDYSSKHSDFVTDSYRVLGLILWKTMSLSPELLSPGSKNNEFLGLL